MDKLAEYGIAALAVLIFLSCLTFGAYFAGERQGKVASANSQIINQVKKEDEARAKYKAADKRIPVQRDPAAKWMLSLSKADSDRD